jgi:hypothetical protein
LDGSSVPGVEIAQRHTLRQRPTGEQGVQAGQRVPAVVQCAQGIECLRSCPVAGEVPLRLLVRVEGTGQLSPHLIGGARLTGAEGMDVQSLTESGDLGLDLSERRLIASVSAPVPWPQSTQPPARSSTHGRNHAARLGRHDLTSTDAGEVAG